MESTFDAIAFDFDGVLVDSRNTAFRITEHIAELFCLKTSVTSMVEYRRVFEEIETQHATEPIHREALRALHRLAMRARAESSPLFEPVFALAGRVEIESVIITSGLRTTVMKRIGDRIGTFRRVLGHEDGLKEHSLEAWSKGRRCLYVGDGIFDIRRCRSCGVQVVAVGWGFDSKEELLQAGPDWFVNDVLKLEILLRDLGIIIGNTEQ